MAKPSCSYCRFYKAKATGMKDAHGVCVAAPWSIDIPDPDVHWCGEFAEAERRAAMVHETAKPISPVVYDGARALPDRSAAGFEFVRVPKALVADALRLIEGRPAAELFKRGFALPVDPDDDRMPAR